MTTQADRLFLLLDPHTRRVVDLCTGPTPSGDCPSHVAGQRLTCAGYRVVPLRRTSANGLPFLVGEREGPRCPLAWLDEGETDAEVRGEGAATEPDAEGWMPPEGHPAPGRVPFRSTL
ncbi:MAG: hypothetical protein ACLQGJ_06445 [Candidatus Dormibacteria bacterium]